MNEPTEPRFPWIAPALLLAVLIGFAVVRPGNLDGSDQPYRLIAGLTAIAAVGYVAWRFHGLIAAAGAIILLQFAAPACPPGAFAELGSDALVLATLALGIAVCSRQAQPGWRPWVILAALSVAMSCFGWLGRGLPQPIDPIARLRFQHVSMALIVLTLVVGLLARRVPFRDRARLFAVGVLIPAVGFTVAHPNRNDWLPLANGAEWSYLPDEWRTALTRGHWADGAWCWTVPWVAGPLVLVGLWRTIARGRKSLAEGRPPLSWLVTAAGLGSIMAIGPRPIAASSQSMAAMGAILSVFGVADLILGLKERIELKPPEPGPSPVPRLN